MNKIVPPLQRAGLPRERAEAVAEAFREGKLVTKDDLEAALNRLLVKLLLILFAGLIGTQALSAWIIIQALRGHLP